MNDYIERQDAIDTHCAICPDKDKCPDVNFICPDRELFRMIKPAYPELDETCYDCPMYDKEKHFCPRYSRVIPDTIKELKQQKIGKWIYSETHGYKCGVCGEPCAGTLMGKPRDRYCKMCGIKLEGVNE